MRDLVYHSKKTAWKQVLALEMGSFIFIDSFQHLGDSLAVLAQNVRDKGKDCFVHTLKHSNPTQQDLLLQNGMFCYLYLDNFNKFYEDSLPPRECFDNDLDPEHISDVKYVHAQNVSKPFSCQTLGDYHDVYLKSDVLILAHVFENFGKFCLKEYSLDPAHFLAESQLSYTALLNFTEVRLELLSGLDMYTFLEEGIRGGYCRVIQRFAAANNRYMRSFDSHAESASLLYIDQNALYSYIIQEYCLLTHGFIWLCAEEIRDLNPRHTADNSNVG